MPLTDSSAAVFEPVAQWSCDPSRARWYAEGWQSWSVATTAAVEAPQWRPGSAASEVIDWQPAGVPVPAVTQASGLLALDPGDGSPVQVLGALDARHQVPRLRARAQGQAVVVEADGPVEEVSDGGPGGLDGALARFAERFCARAGVGALRSAPPMWCSWYSYFTSVTAGAVLANLARIEREGLEVGTVQVDDGYQAATGDWLVPSAHFGDLRATFRAVSESGRRGGIWLAPFLVGRHSVLAADHPDWLVQAEDGQPVVAGWALRDECAALDVTHPAAAAYLSEVLGTFASYGVGFFKLDFIYAGALSGRRHEEVTGVEAYRQGLELVRRAVGPGAYLLGCGAPLLPSVGLVDAMRIGPDIDARYEAEPGQPTMPCQANAARNVRARAWQHGRFWVNDPDCLVAGAATQRREDWARTLEHWGPMRSSGDDLTRLDDWGMATTRRLLRESGTAPLVPAMS